LEHSQWTQWKHQKLSCQLQGMFIMHFMLLQTHFSAQLLLYFAIFIKLWDSIFIPTCNLTQMRGLYLMLQLHYEWFLTHYVCFASSEWRFWELELK
jgi:hypothetical protein